MDYVAVTLSSPQLNQSKDLLLPLDIPQYILAGTLIQVLKITISNTCRGSFSVVEDEKKKVLPSQRTFREMGIKFGQFIVLEFKEILAKASLLCLQGPEFDLNQDEVFIGCRSDMGIDLRGIPKQEFVSGRHAKIFYQGEHYYLMDLGSTNGTKINGTIIPANIKYLLKDGDVILLGITNGEGIQLILKLRKK